MASDDRQLYAIRRDISGGMNNRQIGSDIKDTQVTVLYNIDISVPGEAKKRPGTTLVEDLGDDAGRGIYGFMPINGTDRLIVQHGAKLEEWPGTFTLDERKFNERKTDFTPGADVTMLKVIENGEDTLLVKVEGNNWFSFTQANLDGTGSGTDLGSDTGSSTDDPYDTSVAHYFRQRLWLLKDNLLSWSDVAPQSYTGSFNTANAYKVDVGEERALISIRDTGIISFGSDAIYGVNPADATMANAATDKVEKLLDIGCVAGKTVCQVGDDVLFMAPDGVRGLFRSQQDKLQLGASYPLSFVLKEQYEDISWAYINKACAVFFDNKYFIALPTSSSTYNNQVWVYYPATQAWMVITGWKVGAWTKIVLNGQEKLYYVDANDGSVYRAWYGYDDNGTAINYQEEGRSEHFDKRLVKKCGGELRIRALATGDYDLGIYIDIDGNGYLLLGTMNLDGNAPNLDIALPFFLGAENIKQKVFHLDSYGPFTEIKYKIVHNALNGSDDIKIYERTFITYPEEYQPENVSQS